MKSDNAWDISNFNIIFLVKNPIIASRIKHFVFLKDFIQEFFIFLEFRSIFSKATKVRMVYFEVSVETLKPKFNLFNYLNSGYFSFKDSA